MQGLHLGRVPQQGLCLLKEGRIPVFVSGRTFVQRAVVSPERVWSC